MFVDFLRFMGVFDAALSAKLRAQQLMLSFLSSENPSNFMLNSWERNFLFLGVLCFSALAARLCKIYLSSWVFIFAATFPFLTSELDYYSYARRDVALLLYCQP